jgi:hypothetical protein
MKNLLLMALVVALPACKKKETETAAAPKTVSEGKLDVAVKGVTVERAASEGPTQTDVLTATLALKNTGGEELAVKKIEYTVVTGENRSEAKLWDKDPVTVSEGESQELELPARMMWDGAGEFPFTEVNFDGTVYYTTHGVEKTEPFKVTSPVTKK